MIEMKKNALWDTIIKAEYSKSILVVVLLIAVLLIILGKTIFNWMVS